MNFALFWKDLLDASNWSVIQVKKLKRTAEAAGETHTYVYQMKEQGIGFWV
jgi:hypothetical protein